MADDATSPPFPLENPATPPPTGTQTKTETKIETIENDSGAQRGRRAGEMFGMSGRFWVVLIAMIGATIITVLCIRDVALDPQTKGVVIGAYLALAGSCANTYMGQNAGPTKPKPS